MASNITCKMCNNTPKKNTMTKISNLPKTFIIILEEMGGRKFSKADELTMVICMKCLDFLKNMENSSSRPKSNKITEAGKKRVFKLMEKRRVPAAQAIEIVLAEQRARELLLESGIMTPGGRGGSGEKQAIAKPTADLAGVSLARPRLSGAQRKKANILIDAGMDPESARQLVYAASIANKVTQPIEMMNKQDSNEQRGSRSQRRSRQRNANANSKGPLPKNSTGQRNNPPKGDNAQIGKAKPAQNPPVQRVAPVKAAAAPANAAPAEKTGAGPKGSNQKGTSTKNIIVASPGILLPANMRQNNRSAAGARGSNSDRRVGVAVKARSNERPAPYTNNRQSNQSHRNQMPPHSNRQQNQSNQYQQNQSDFQNNQNNNFNQSKQRQEQIMSFEVGIVPINYPNDVLDDLKLDALKEAITNEILKIPQGGPLIRFLGTSSQNGWLKVICADNLSYNWLAMLVSRWERAGVRMVEGNAMPQPAILTFYLQGDFRSPDEILNIIEKQNTALNAKQWRVINRESDGNGQRITVCVDEQCFQALRSRDFMVYLGLGVVELKPRRSASDEITYNNNSNSSSLNFMDNDNFHNSGNNNMHGGRGGGMAVGMGNDNYKSMNSRRSDVNNRNYQWGGRY